MDLELRHNDPKTFPVTHKIEALGRVSPPPLLKKMSEYQLVTIAGAASGFLAGVVLDWLNHFAASLTAGSTSSIAVNPIWVVKTRLMLQTGSEKVYYKGTLDAFRTMYNTEGVGVFYSGLVPSLFGLVHVGIHFPVYEALKRSLHVSDSSQISHGSYHKLWRLIAASTISKVIASTVTYPHEILRTRMQMQKSANSSSVTLRSWIRSIYNREGLRGFYAGYLTNLARTLPASAVTLVSFEYFKTYLLEISGKV
ncbi:hypothetical_protein [Candidozyma auris]|uniref:hypothetical_protein n=1 Tax=Candidozyma auris TaxID=498019 RepID=UPI0012538A44|nr:hypothetical_protein [[Candida] auris]QEO23426.1 hypothetical_protein [[Candida] auris]